jgi:hypothetical protein
MRKPEADDVDFFRTFHDHSREDVRSPNVEAIEAPELMSDCGRSVQTSRVILNFTLQATAMIVMMHAK